MSIARTLFRGLGRRLPIVNGEIQLEELQSPVSIRRDEFGVPHINAGNEHDAWFALGFCQGQDRAFQLEMLARSVRGTLSEVIGVDGLAVDRLSRRVGLKLAAEEQLQVLDNDVRDAVTAFAQGVNAGRERGQRRRAHEFSLLRMEPTEWTATDSLGYLKLMSLVISTNWAEELARYQILIRDGVEALEALEPGVNPDMPVTSPPGAAAGDAVSSLITEARNVVMELGLDSGGSNNWVVSGARTKSGKPILSNDVHLPALLPAHFYLAHVSTPEWGLAGGAFAGTPGFFLGHNGFAAWGVTIGFLDNTDLFLEDIGPDGASVREGDEYVQCDVREEQIKVKGADDVTERVLITGRGPIVGPALDGRPMALSMSAVWLRAAPFQSVFRAYRWRSFDEFSQDLEHHPHLSLNIVYADDSGDIGWKLAGALPRRAGSGAMPSPASDPVNHWRGEPKLSDERLVARNPECGYIATANNRPIPNAEVSGLGVDWLEGYRLARIHELLRERDDWEPGDMWLLHLDTESLPWRELKPLLANVEAVDDDSRSAGLMLGRWDGSVSAGSASAALFELFVASLLQKIAERAAPVSWTWALGKGGAAGLTGNYFNNMRMNQLITLVTQRPDGWFEHGWNAAIANSMGDALRTLRFRFGPHTRNWNWGRVRPLNLSHRAGRGPLAPVFNRGPYTIGGDTNTVGAAGVHLIDPLGGVRSTATARTVIEIGDWDNARFVILGGQSGNPLSPHYDDQAPVWLQGRGIPVHWSPAAVEAATRSTLRLVPE